MNNHITQLKAFLDGSVTDFIPPTRDVFPAIRQLLRDYRTAVEALEAADALIESAQDIARDNIVPDGISNEDAISAYIELLDNVRQRKVQTDTFKALTTAEAYEEIMGEGE